MNDTLTFVYVINVDWYFKLHWLKRALAVLYSGAKVHLVLGVTDTKLMDEFTNYGFICHPWQLNRNSINIFANINELVGLFRLLKSITPSLVHAITIKPNIYVGLIAYWIKAPYVLSVTGTGTVFSNQHWTIKCIRPLVRLLFKWLKTGQNIRKIIFENKDDQHYFVTTRLCHASEAVTILGAGVDTALYYPSPEMVSDTPVILFAARLLWDKGLGDLVQAGRNLRTLGVKFIIQVAGIIDASSNRAIAIRVLEDWHKEGVIEWLGMQTNMPELINRSHIIVLPSFYGEGVPRILIEAAACGRPIITTNMPGCREIVRQGINGFLISPHDVDALGQALLALINNPELRLSMGAQGRELVVSQFSEAQVIKETLVLYQELLP
ncbi:MAG: glycosyltransferase family 4 protein [Methylococcaceae bacterium]|jgi:glycosyltransferase involved in cell wall biosynthesis